MRQLYTLLLYLALPLVLARLGLRGFSNRGYWRNVPERLGFGVPAMPGRPVWIHAVSVGEVQAAALLRAAVERAVPGAPLLVTTMTPTGRERAQAAFAATEDAPAPLLRYLPYDLPDALSRFLGATRPRALLLMETELWPNLLHACAARGIPVVLANARMSARSAAGYAKVAGFTRRLLGRLAAVAAQSEDDARRLAGLGAPEARMVVTGSVKYDVSIPPPVRAAARALRRRLGAGRPVWIAASTHGPEEAAVLDACEHVRAALPGALLVIVPRHPERFGPAAAACRDRGLRVLRRSEQPGNAPLEDCDVYVGDTMGELLTLYGAADVAFVGGSLTSVGGHNYLEPAALSLPMLTGPHVFNFADIARRLAEVGALREVGGAASLAQAVTELLRDAQARAAMGERAARIVEGNRGAAERVADILRTVLAGAGV